jgi:hypothetical protein
MRCEALVRRTASLVALLECVACASSPPAPRADRPAPSAVEWTGSRARPLPPGQSGAAPAARVPPGGRTEAWVLHVGDSFVHAHLWQTLRPLFLANQTQYVVEATTATYTTTWAASPVLDEWLARRPSLVLVTLGANEVEMVVPEQHAKAIETLTKKIAATGAPCVWITPPMWKDETGILGVIHDHCAPCLFFDSDAVLGGLTSEERQPDRIHPNHRGGERWGRAFWDWLSEHRDPAHGPWALHPFEQRG